MVVHITDISHNWCNIKPDNYLLQSCWILDHHKTFLPPTGTGQATSLVWRHSRGGPLPLHPVSTVAGLPNHQWTPSYCHQSTEGWQSHPLTVDPPFPAAVQMSPAIMAWRHHLNRTTVPGRQVSCEALHSRELPPQPDYTWWRGISYDILWNIPCVLSSCDIL